MSQEENTALNYVHGQLDELKRVTREIYALQQQADALAEMATLEILDGWSTSDELLDFAMVSCCGVYDEYVVNELYPKLSVLGLRRPGQKVMLIQKALYVDEEDSYFLRNIHLVTLRADVLKTDIDSISISLPVEPGRLVWREFLNTDGDFVSGHKIHHDRWLRIGPLYNEHCDYGNAKEEYGLIFTPIDAPCETEFIPESDKLDLYNYHDIDVDLLNYLTTTWIRELSRP